MRKKAKGVFSIDQQSKRPHSYQALVGRTSSKQLYALLQAEQAKPGSFCPEILSCITQELERRKDATIMEAPQKYPRETLETMSTDQLNAILDEYFCAQKVDLEYMEFILSVLDVLEKREGPSPSPSLDAAWEEIKKRYLPK